MPCHQEVHTWFFVLLLQPPFLGKAVVSSGKIFTLLFLYYSVTPLFFKVELVTSLVIAWKIPYRFQNNQQQAELYSFIRLLLFCCSYSLWSINVVLDSATAIYSALKMSCGAFNVERNSLLIQLSDILTSFPFIVHLGFTRSANNPADFPSRASLPFNTLLPHTSFISQQLQFFHHHPRFIAHNQQEMAQLCISPTVKINSDQWSSPSLVRTLVHNSQFPPSFDLCAEWNNSLCHKYSNSIESLSASSFLHCKTAFINPPFSILSQVWVSLLKLQAHMNFLWCLLPTSCCNFFISQLSTRVIATHHLHIKYNHPLFPSYFVPFNSTLCLLHFIH